MSDPLATIPATLEHLERRPLGEHAEVLQHVHDVLADELDAPDR